ncbi:MAG: peptidase M28, partial [Gammaproteobacteria bacterium]|nr:peptidase M28 [Gammaproteobacteria bacterium]
MPTALRVSLLWVLMSLLAAGVEAVTAEPSAAGVDSAAADGPEPIHQEPIQHRLSVQLDIDARRLVVEDRIRLPAGTPRSLRFQLHGGLDPRVVSDGAILKRLDATRRGVPVETWRLRLEPDVREVTLRYGGEIHHPVAELGAAYSRSFSVSPGLIDADGVFLGGSSHWVPVFAEQPYLAFRMTVDLPAGWRAVSQGEREGRQVMDGMVRETWSEGHRQEEVYLIAAPFTEYRQPGTVADAVVFLRKPDEALADRYLELTGRYLAMYEALIGDYPYAKFALVENFWETGYGMPSFTLLGPRVIRLPFIPYTSYPHEILHNWWGNGVYVDFASGNWSEGLTSYLADHLLKEQRGKGADYRREALQKYADYVGDHDDFALTEFRGRHNAVTEAVGYGKTLMVFHMLRQTLGEDEFRAALRRFYETHRFRVASWSDVAATFEAIGGDALDGFFDQWVNRAGAPALRLRDASAEPDGAGYALNAVLEQTQDGPAYRLEVPVAIMLEGQDEAVTRMVAMDGREQAVELDLPARPLRIAVDPAFDLFRRLYREEIPPAISQALGADRVLVVLPASAPKSLQNVYRQLAQSWQRGRSVQLAIRRDDELDALPDDRAVWLLGWRNRFRPMLEQALGGYAFSAEADQVRIGESTLNRSDNSVVVLARDPANPEQALGWVATDNPAAIPGLARKLPHYGKYSYLGFRGDAPDNVLKGQWPPQASPLSVTLVADAPPLNLPSRAPLAELPP